MYTSTGLRASNVAEDDFASSVRPHLLAMTRLAARLGPPGAHDDIVQEALIRAWRHRQQFDPRRGSRATWLLKIVANEALRARRRIRHFTLVASGPDGGIEDRLDVEAAVRRLPRRQRLAVNCFYYTGLSVAETAAVMGCAEGTVKATLADARSRLRLQMEESR